MKKDFLNHFQPLIPDSIPEPNGAVLFSSNDFTYVSGWDYQSAMSRKRNRRFVIRVETKFTKDLGWFFNFQFKEV